MQTVLNVYESILYAPQAQLSPPSGNIQPYKHSGCMIRHGARCQPARGSAHERSPPHPWLREPGRGGCVMPIYVIMYYSTRQLP